MQRIRRLFLARAVTLRRSGGDSDVKWKEESEFEGAPFGDEDGDSNWEVFCGVVGVRDEIWDSICAVDWDWDAEDDWDGIVELLDLQSDVKAADVEGTASSMCASFPVNGCSSSASSSEEE